MRRAPGGGPGRLDGDGGDVPVSGREPRAGRGSGARGLVVTGAPLAALSVAPWFGHQDAAWSEASPMGYHSSMDNRQVWPAVGYDAMALNTVEKEGKEWDVVRADILAPGGRQDR